VRVLDVAGAVALVVRRSLRRHALSTAVTVVAAALAGGLVLSVFSIEHQARRAFTGGRVGFDAVLGARGSQLQLVLNTVFHLETSPGNLPWSLYTRIREDPRVRVAVPYATGDSFAGFRIVGTVPERFTELEKGADRPLRPARGRLFDRDRAEAVLGSTAARTTGLEVGDTFHPSHGTAEIGGEEHADEYTVVGVLAPTNSPSDRVIWIPIEGIFRMEGHVLRGAGEEYAPRPGTPIPDEHKEVSAVVLDLASPVHGFELARELARDRDDATLAFPVGRVLANLFEKLGWIHRIFAAVAWLVVGVSAAGILASVYNTIRERRGELAVLRALGARRGTVFAAVVTEAAAIAGSGAALGFVVYGATASVASQVVRARTGIVLDVLAPHPVFWWMPLAMVILGALAGVVPAVKAYSTDVATHLQASP